MKKILLILVLLSVSVAAQQNMTGNITGNITQTVTGAVTLDNSLTCLQEDRWLLFGPTGSDVFGYNNCVRADFFEVNGILTGCQDMLCDLTTTLETELQATDPHTTKEQELVDTMLDELDDSTDCLIAVYNGSLFNGTPQSGIVVGSKSYFNTVKPCFVRTISALGVLEQIYIDEPNASFLVQKLQAIEQDYQHLLTIEDLKVPKSFNVTNTTLNSTLNGQLQAAQEEVPLPQELAITGFTPAGAGVNTFNVINNNGNSISSFAISIAWTDPLGPGQCTAPLVPSECEIGPSPALASAPALGAGVIFCNFIIQCGQGTEPFVFSFSPVGIGAPPDNFHLVSILTPDAVNSNNFDIGAGSGISVAVPFLNNPIVGSSAVAFWPAGSSLLGTTFVYGLGLAIETPNKVDMVSVSIGPTPEGAAVVSGYTGAGPMNTPVPIVTPAIGGVFDVVTSFAYGLGDDGGTFSVIWPAVAPPSLAGVGAVVANGKGDADYQVNAIAIDSIGAVVPAGITGAFAFEGVSESGTLALIVAVIVVIAAFLFVLRRRP
ncbi:hypothetical protein KY309_00695 [Candidatus Woesearchaeota archaeon]|nr:hypothetical protein [Candidatus Woesearchaeota archaeon]